MLLLQIRKGGILEDIKAPYKLALAIKSFLLEVPVNKVYKELGMAYNAAHKVYHTIRETIYQLVKEDDMFSGAIEMDKGSLADKMVGKG